MERSKAGTEERSPDGLSLPNQNTIRNIIWLYFIRNGKKYNEIQLTKNKRDLNNRKNKNNPPSPVSREQLENHFIHNKKIETR